jgi:predicted metalloendopeptidase
MMDYNYLKENGNPGLIDGYTPEQRFFMSWATIGGLKQEMQQSRTK